MLVSINLALTKNLVFFNFGVFKNTSFPGSTLGIEMQTDYRIVESLRLEKISKI